MGSSSPNFGVKIKNLGNHHPENHRYSMTVTSIIPPNHFDLLQFLGLSSCSTPSLTVPTQGPQTALVSEGDMPSASDEGNPSPVWRKWSAVSVKLNILEIFKMMQDEWIWMMELLFDSSCFDVSNHCVCHGEDAKCPYSKYFSMVMWWMELGGSPVDLAMVQDFRHLTWTWSPGSSQMKLDTSGDTKACQKLPNMSSIHELCLLSIIVTPLKLI